METETQKLKSIHFRAEQWLDKLIQTDMNVHRLKSKTEAIHYAFRELQILRQQQKQNRKTREDATTETHLEDKPFPPCPFRVYVPPQNEPICLNKKPPLKTIKPLIPQVCEVCQQLMLSEKIMKKTVKSPNPSKYLKKAYKKPRENYKNWYTNQGEPFKGNSRDGKW